MFWLHKFGKCTWWSASAGLSSSTIEINLLMTGIPWLFSLFVPFRPRFSELALFFCNWNKPEVILSFSDLNMEKSYSDIQRLPLELCSTLGSRALRQSKDTGCSALSIYTWLTENSQEKGCSGLARKYPHPSTVDSSNFFETLFEKQYLLIFTLYCFQVIVKFSKHVW